ncbi:Jacalin-like lectin domain [Phytophthora infestans]|uniref:Jacalin-like lectin domain n=1 Tax=Phytophthora infestans TaxID=4787 RepID=A0A8S9V9S3_PHYIN|nr:Jacalin-like lectin domain [Phytophthora infestans]
MKLVFQLVATVGHADQYSDLDLVGPGQTVQALTVRSGKRVSGVGLDITNVFGQQVNLYHGGDGGDKNTLTLGRGEYITAIEAHWGEKGDHTRIKYIRFNTTAGNTISGGNPTENIGMDSAPVNYQLGGFVGYCGRELDSVGAVWTRISSVDPTRQAHD